MRKLTCMVIVLVTVAYIAIGGVVFHVLEAENETTVRIDADHFFMKFLKNNTCVSREELRELLSATYEAYQSGHLAAGNDTDTSTQTNWDYYSSIFFAMTVVTTIGYGNISPSTLGGQIFCVVFALFGIPLFLVTATAIGKRLYWIIRKSQKRCFQPKEDGTARKSARVCGSLFYVMLGIVLFILVPAALFMLMEGWHFLEAAYYSFITVTTIGFGDYVAGTEDTNEYKGFRGIYRLAVAGWIFIGLSWMAGVISSLQDLFSRHAETDDSDLNSTPRNSQSDSSRNGALKVGKRELGRVWSRDSGYDGINGVKSPYNRQASYDSIYNNHTTSPRGSDFNNQTPPPTYDKTMADTDSIMVSSDEYLTKL